MEVLGLRLSSSIEGDKGTFNNIDGEIIEINLFELENNGEYSYKTENKALKSDYTAIATCNLVTINKEGLEQELFKYVLEDKTKTLLISQKELDEIFIKN